MLKLNLFATSFLSVCLLAGCNKENNAPSLIERTPMGLAEGTVVTSFPENTLLEGIVLDQKGTMYLSQITSGQVIAVTPDGKQSVLATLPMGTSAFIGGKGSMGAITMGKDGKLYIGVNNGADVNAHGIWQIDPITGQASLFAALPLTTVSNGIAFDSKGNLFFADSEQGALWQVKNGTREADIWLQDTSFISTVPGIPSINGLQIAHKTLYVTVPGKGYVIAVALTENGEAGPIRIVNRTIPGDDFAIDREGNLFITTHVFNTVIKLHNDFVNSRVIANPDNGIIGPAAAAFGTLPGDTGSLYVVTDGGLYGFDANRPRGFPSVIRLKIYQ